MITIDYRTKTSITNYIPEENKHDAVGEATASVRESFEDNEQGMARFEDLCALMKQNVSYINGGIQLTWTPAEEVEA